MTDLFYSGTTDTAEQIDLLRQDILSYAKAKYKYRKKKLPIVWGDINNVDNNILIIQSPMISGKDFFQGEEFEGLISVLNFYKIDKYFITYSNLLRLERHTRKTNKEFSPWIHKLIDILRSRMIVILGEDVEQTFLTKKYMLRDYHGKKIGEYQSIPIYLTYPMYYYYEHSAYEDTAYKKFLQETDWNAIKEKWRSICQ